MRSVVVAVKDHFTCGLFGLPRQMVTMPLRSEHDHDRYSEGLVWSVAFPALRRVGLSLGAAMPHVQQIQDVACSYLIHHPIFHIDIQGYVILEEISATQKYLQAPFDVLLGQRHQNFHNSMNWPAVQPRHNFQHVKST